MCSTGNSSVRSANTAKLARDLKDNALGLAKANLDNANLAQIAKEERRNLDNLRRQIQAMEAAMAIGLMYPLGQRSNQSQSPPAERKKLASVSETKHLGANILKENEGSGSA